MNNPCVADGTIMDPQFELKYHQLEEHHWWFRARRDMVCRMLGDCAPSKDVSVLEIGCSGGPLLADLKLHGFENVVGIDISESAVARCRARGFDQTFAMDGTNPGFLDGQFDVVIASDVLEHLRDEERALSNWSRLLRPQGTLIVFVPAYSWLWSEHDEVNHHFRRYNRAQLGAVLQRAGFQVERRSYWNSTLLAPVALVRWLSKIPRFFRRGGRRDHLHGLPQVLNRAVLNLLLCENRVLGSGVNFPFGVSTFAVARKPGSVQAAPFHGTSVREPIPTATS